MSITRRNFIKSIAGAAATTTAVAALTGCQDAETAVQNTPKGKPKNILLISADQLSRHAIGSYGNKEVQTPSIDKIIRSGTRFNSAYCAYPLCGPSRASFWTGRLPHQNGVHGNNSPNIPETMTTLGELFTQAGYEAVHFGKRHDFGSLKGFECSEQIEIDIDAPEAFPVNYDSREDVYAEQKSVEYLQKKHDKPFIMAVDFNNPHNICGWVGAFDGPHGDIPGLGPLPPLRNNFENLDAITERPPAIQHLCCTHHRMHQAAHWNELNYRQYLAAYYHYTKMGDDSISRVLDAQAKSDAADNTLIIFFSDHGDGMGSHRLVTKFNFFYEETTNIPFVISGPGIPEGKQNDELVSLCDLVPTLCDYADIEAPEGLYGRSVLPLLTGETPADWREAVVSQWYTSREMTVEPARMYRTKTHKYTVYQEGGEELFDMVTDPGETRNLATDPAYSDLLNTYRQAFSDYTQQWVDPFKALAVNVDLKWRAHAPGYENHEGACAIDAYLKAKEAAKKSNT
ncbi:sulfatase-like hydrolase/transferase [uncultured Photobacterium sp.]|uniref:sulfatase family protein n=1 Tax=uncultured Photobacterium sp. TaxID=173973 RepID=UPI00263762B7|nr:sulfatase-like hydrolase/transferase [uncultured Photobacterium sp.]